MTSKETPPESLFRARAEKIPNPGLTRGAILWRPCAAVYSLVVTIILYGPWWDGESIRIVHSALLAVECGTRLHPPPSGDDGGSTMHSNHRRGESAAPDAITRPDIRVAIPEPESRKQSKGVRGSVGDGVRPQCQSRLDSLRKMSRRPETPGRDWQMRPTLPRPWKRRRSYRSLPE